MENNEIVYLYLDDIIPNRFQPREVFDEQALKELAVSIKEHGVIQPIIVRKVGNKYEIIAGERRYKASTMAGLTKIPAIVKNLDDQESSKIALIENLQRKDLTPIEEARTYQKILELEPGMTQEELAETMGKTQSVVSNKIRLLALPDEVQDALLKEKISERHARSLLNLNNNADQIKLLDKVITERMTVRDLDKEIKEMNEQNGQSGQGGQGGQNLSNNNASMNFNNETPTVEQREQTNDNGNNLGASMFNPTEVDINKIRENSFDINAPKEPPVDINSLMRDTTKKEENTFKFVPSFAMGDNNNENNANIENNNGNTAPFANPGAPSIMTGLSSSDTNGMDNNNNQFNNQANDQYVQSLPTTPFMKGSFFDDAPSNPVNKFMNSPTPDNEQNLSSEMSIPTFNFSAFTNTNKKDVTPAVNDIKEKIKDLEKTGYKVMVSENDLDNYYEITIKVDKNS